MSRKDQDEEIGFTQDKFTSAVEKAGSKAEYIFPNTVRLYVPEFDLVTMLFQRSIVTYLVKLIEQSGYFFPLPTTDPSEKSASYILNYRLDVQKPLYSSKSFTFPMVIEQERNYVKRVSKRHTAKMMEPARSRDLVTATWVEVNIDPKTKRPQPFPDWWKTKYNIPDKGPPLEIHSAPKPPANVLSDKREIYITETDENNHTNYITYLNMCLDCFYNNVLHEKYRRSPKVLLNGWVKTMTVIYKSDSVLGDILTIDSWEDSDRDNTFHFEILNNNRIAVLVSFEFYTSVTEESSRL